jgi:hypothetical protein
MAFHLPWLTTLARCAHEDARNGEAFLTLTAAEARTMRAFASQVLSSSEVVPDADEAGAVYFVDRALGTSFFSDKAALVRAGFADLDRRARSFDAHAGFASLSSAQQMSIMQRVEREPYFAAARMLVVIGTLADPSHGGNRDTVGWTMIGMDHSSSYSHAI